MVLHDEGERSRNLASTFFVSTSRYNTVTKYGAVTGYGTVIGCGAVTGCCAEPLGVIIITKGLIEHEVHETTMHMRLNSHLHWYHLLN